MRRLRAGDFVEVRSKEEILATLDSNGRLEGLPFMPQMFKYCRMRFVVYKRAHKTCDTINQSGGRKLSNTVHLDTRCDGQAYGGCQASCLIFWKEAWLRRLNAADSAVSRSITSERSGCTETAVWNATQEHRNETVKYSCQATELLDFTTPLPWWDVRQYIEDVVSGNVTVGKLCRGLIYSMYFHFRAAVGYCRPLDSAYDWIQNVLGGVPFPRRAGKAPPGQVTPLKTLDLRPGELVRIKPYPEILSTLDTNNRNRGLYFDAEAVPYCGKTFRVRSRVSRFINEKTGYMTELRTPAVILEGVWCRARYSDCRMHCPRSIYSWWREVWLERGDRPRPCAVPDTGQSSEEQFEVTGKVGNSALAKTDA